MTDGPSDIVPEIPDFELIREIGRGGFGQVWLAKNRATGLLRAVKLIARGASGAAGRELVSITRLETIRHRRHPNLLDIHHVGQTQSFVFFVTDLADTVASPAGTDPAAYVPATLERRLNEGPASPADCLDWTRQLLLALASLHQAGMVHRDVKPANCVFVDGQLKLADFGLLADADPRTSRMGTRAYMPPDGEMDTRADVYAAGLVIYEMLTGHPVERFPQLGDRAETILCDPLLSVLLNIVLDACQLERDRRFADAGCMLTALDRRIREEPQRSLAARIAIAVAVLALAGTLIWGGFSLLSPSQVDVNFVTYPFGATVLLDGEPILSDDGRPATTPCPIDHLSGRQYEVKFQHPDLPDLNLGTIDLRRQRQVVGSWDEEIGEGDLP